MVWTSYRTCIAGRAAQFPPQWLDDIQGRIVVRTANDMIDEKKCNNGAGTWQRGSTFDRALAIDHRRQPPLAHMANYAHHQSRSGAHGGNPDALANCVFAAKACWARFSSTTTTVHYRCDHVH